MITFNLAKTNQFIGLMSGTSMDAIDAVVVDFTRFPKIIAMLNYPIPDKFKQQCLDITTTGHCHIEQLGELDHWAGHLFSEAAKQLLVKANLNAADIVAIGCHGQTLWHKPIGSSPFSLQIGDPNVIKVETNIATIADFRRRDLAIGGQGAPLAPAFHQQVFKSCDFNRAIVNIGGISNVTLLPKEQNGKVLGFDSGPGNCLLDELALQHFGTAYDQDGKLSRQGKVVQQLLDLCLNDPFINRKPPKSTGREYFNLQWLQNKLALCGSYSNYDVMATMLHFTARTIVNAITSNIEQVYLCGGGANNSYLLELLASMLHCPVATTRQLGFDPNWVEAVLMAWLAKQTIENKVGNVPSVTGASKEVTLGAIYL